MILLKTVVLFVLANPAEFYPLSPEQKAKPCGLCSKYLNATDVPEYPEQPIDIQKNIQKNSNYPCGQSNPNGLLSSVIPDLNGIKNGNTTETKNTKIFGGINAQRNEFPWQVGLAFGYGRDISCGGSIISSREILTAAHCVQDGRYINPIPSGEVFPKQKCIYAVVGDHNKSSENKGEQWNRICDVKVHKDYKGIVHELINTKWVKKNYNENDFAVLTLCTELQFTDKVAPVCLPMKMGGTYDDYVQKDVWTSGWGEKQWDSHDATTILQKVKLKTWSNTACFGLNNNPNNDKPSQICAYGATGEYTCQGDNGGPLVISEDINGNKIYTLIGVTAHGKGCLEFTQVGPNVYGRVTYAMEWIAEKINPDGSTGIQGQQGYKPALSGPAVCATKSIELLKDSKNSRSLKNTEGVTYYHFEKDKKLSKKNAQKTCISKYGGQLTSINTKDEYEWIKEQVIDLKMFGQIAIGGQWKDKSSRKFEWTDKSEMDMSVLNANWFRTRNYQFPSYKNKKRINLELWYSRRAMGFANALDHKAPTMYICKVAKSCSSCSSCA